MTTTLKIILAQLNFTVGDITGNLQKHIDVAIKARDELHADVIVFPELSLTGYPPEDLLLRKDFLEKTQAALHEFTQAVKDIYCVVGHPLIAAKGIQNACSVLFNGNIIGQYKKQHLPNYGVFDESRYFIPDNTPCVVSMKGIPTGIVICEDLWYSKPIQKARDLGAKLILSPNASPFEIDKHELRVATLSERIQENHLPILYTNLIGGQDELIFDGGSMAMQEPHQISQLAPFFEEALLSITANATPSAVTLTTSTLSSFPSRLERIYQSLVLSVRDYINKNHFPGVYVGVSGGIDSALTMAIAVDALGKEHVHPIALPSRYTSEISMQDATELVHLLDVKLETISIEPLYEASLQSLAPLFKNKKIDITEENLQARCRGMILMALSNKFGNLVLTTGNRSELAVGYCTLYGDMAGGFDVLKDLPKMLVYALAKYRNTLGKVIPERTLTRPPTAELAHNQKDEDSLPPYPILDEILYAYLNEGKNPEEISAAGFPIDTVKKIISLISKSEYKRRQAPIGPRINNKSFGKDWRYPITNGFKG